MSSELVVRDLEPLDLDALLALYAHLHAQDDALPEPRELQRIWQGIHRDPALIYLGGFLDGELISVCNAAVIANLTRGARPYAVVENVVTHAHHRRRGFGAAVLGGLLERCKAMNCYKVMLMSAMSRADQHPFYEAMGFDKHGKQAFVMSVH
jgi:GNAT superfamily N-acetyltransferase